jgi:ribosomal-protein-alanine N-acetyltransferase
MNEIETARLRLRPFRMEDVDLHQQVIYGDPVVAEYLTLAGPQPIAETRDVIEWWVEHQEMHGFAPWAVIHKETGQWMGQCGLMYVPGAEDGAIELLYAYGKEFWRQGYGTEAANACLRYGFESAGLARVDAFAIPDNIGSQRVMQKVGMTYQATDDRYYDYVLARYAITREEFTPADSQYMVR